MRRLGYGAMQLCGPGVVGPPTDRDGAIDVLRTVVDMGVNFIDTADAYGPFVNEDLIAEALFPYTDDLVLATKGGLVRLPDGSWEPNGRPEHLKAAAEASIGRLGVDALPLYQLHRPDPDVPFAESVGALADLQTEGKVRFVGLSNVDLAQLREAQEIVDIVSVQNPYNLHDRHNEDVLRACEGDRLAFLPYFPLKGFGYAKGTPALTEVGAAHDATAAQAALAWLLGRSPVMLPIPGTSSLSHLRENVAAAALTLSEAERERLDAFSPSLSAKLGQLQGPLSASGRAKLREAAGPLRRLWAKLRFWD